MTNGGGHVEWYGDQLLAVIEKLQPDGLYEAGLAVLEIADQLVPVGESGNLKSSGYVATIEKSGYRPHPKWRKELKPLDPRSAVITYHAPHAQLVERGTVRMAAQPFLRPALDSSGDAVGVAYTQEMRPRIEKEQAKKRRREARERAKAKARAQAGGS